jgi:hypothetical protein
MMLRIVSSLPTEPTQTWTNVYYNGTTPDYVSYEWSPMSETTDPETGATVQYVGGYDNDSVELKLSGLPRHTYAQMNLVLAGPAFGATNITATADGTSLNVDRGNNTWYVNTDWDDRDALKHGGSSMTISFQTTGFEQGWTWGGIHGGWSLFSVREPERERHGDRGWKRKRRTLRGHAPISP